ncbi:hypothetical protein [Paenibacillus sp. NEAU-GSW1]|uniref:hypothetical protein n=1 Tax=Paenibacillus sp. NEAU-GSW1 TaxID=2682486 RepID=UPI0012E16493|nr:hypothetical protein [Paenibacillus sp. NEAU-GSW1]MUT66334.1 hypothetical protein [Paenibacillus sp. NEAU-GSW1]
MNISQMMRGLLGETTPGETRAMELKAGQVVRGVVVQVMENNEAVVQINGVQVKAQLEAPLQQGQAAMLQVQPQSDSSLIVLKPVDPSVAGSPESELKDLAKLLGLPEQKWAIELVKELRREGYTINREAARLFMEAAAAMPKGADAEQWMQAAAAAFKRGLPMTAGTVSGLLQVKFGRPAHELLELLQQQLADVTANGSSDADAPGTANAAAEKRLPQLAARLQAMLSGGADLMRVVADGAEHMAGRAAARESGLPANAGLKLEGQAAGNAAPGAAAESASRISAASNGANKGMTNLVNGASLEVSGETEAQAANSAKRAEAEASPPRNAMLNAAAGGSDASEHDAGIATARQAALTPTGGAAASNWLGQMMKWMGVDYENQLLKQLPSNSPASAPAAAAIPANPAEQPQSTVPNNVGRQIDAEVPVRGGAELATVKPDAPQTTAHVSTVAMQQSAHERAAEVNKLPQAAGMELERLAASGELLHNDTKVASHDSLKSLLLAVAASDDAPAALRDTAQQLVQQITGQQLMLTPERNGDLFSHMTMYIPLNGPDGNQTASVQIQTRRGRKGELDAENCRLLFHLSMRNLGETIVDVNVTDKIVSLTIWNDHPAIGALTEASRSEVAESLGKSGYQLLSLRTTPTFKGESAGELEKNAAAEPSTLASGRYKGVDFRI